MPVFYTNTGSLGNLQVSGSTVISASTSNLVRVVGSGSSILTVSGSSGPILEVSDVNAGNPKILVFSSGSGANSITVFSIETNKRVEISGSLVVTGSITGSLLGTASYATSALTASFALNAGGSTTSRISSGSVSASVNVGNSDTFRIVSASSTFVYVSASGNVGIGTTNPLYKLQVSGDIVNSTNVNSTGDPGIEVGASHRLGFNEAGVRSWTIKPTGGNLQFFSGDNLGSHIFSANAVGINDSPSGKLEVYDNITFSTIDTFPQFSVKSATGTTGNRLNLGVDQANGLSFIQSVNRGTGATPLILQRYAGNVGVGTTNPQGKLDVNGMLVLGGYNFATNSAAYNIIYTQGGAAGIYLGGSGDAANYYDNTNHYFRNIGGGTTYALLNATGLSVGKVSPNGMLDVNGNAFITGSTRITGSLAVVGNLTVSTGSGTFDRGLYATRSFEVIDQSLANSLKVLTDSFTLTSTNLDVTHNVRESVDAFVIYDTINSRTAFRYNNEGLNFTIDPASQNSISIGKQSDPTAKVDISGSVKITGSLEVSQGVTASLFGTSSWALNVVGGASSFPFTGSARITGSLNVVGPSTITGSLVVSGANGAGIFSQGATLVDYLGGITNSASYMVWRAPFSCSVVALYGYYIGGTSPQVNAFRSGSSGIGRLTGSNLTLTAANVWTQAIVTGLQNTEFNVGDGLQVVISGSTNNQIAVQVDFIRKF